MDLQGLLIGDDDLFTEAVEAFDVLDPAIDFVIGDHFGKRELFAKAKLAAEIDIPFSIWVHHIAQPGRNVSMLPGTSYLEFYRYELNENETLGAKVTAYGTCSETKFIAWWARNKTTLQTKEFYEADHIDGYFDKLLGNNGLAWGGNVDGILFNKDYDTIIGIVEIRCTKKDPLNNYDPSRYFKGTPRKPQGDINTWKPVIDLANQLHVPCYLMTFPANEQQKQFGMATVEGYNENGLIYRNSEPPYKHIFETSEQALKYSEQATREGA